jgi:hypothetical protein
VELRRAEDLNREMSGADAAEVVVHGGERAVDPTATHEL